MRYLCAFLAAGLIASLPLRAVYAPVPEHEQGKAWTVSLGTRVGYDSNIFGAAAAEIDSMVFAVNAGLAFNASVTDQTFASASYRLNLEHVVDRPGDQTLDGHELTARLAHAFTPETTIDFADSFNVARNPESLLAGVPLNTDQSYKSNQLDGRFTTAVSARTALTLKARNLLYRYDNAVLSRDLDRAETLLGLSGSHALLPVLKVVAEYRHQTIDYRQGSGTKDKTSDFALAGADYAVGKRTQASGRVGVERRRRSAESGDDLPYVELSGKFDYGRRSFVAGGYVYTLEETSNVQVYTDTQVNRFFLNAQQELTAAIIASGSVTYEPSKLQGRRNVSPDRDETTSRAGVGLTYLAAKNWALSANFDYDRIDSDDPGREQTRSRAGVNARYTF